MIATKLPQNANLEKSLGGLNQFSEKVIIQNRDSQLLDQVAYCVRYAGIVIFVYMLL